MIDQQRREQPHQVGDREAEHLHRQVRALGELHLQRVEDEHAVEHERGGQIDEPAHAGDERHQRHGRQQHGVQQHLQPRERDAVRHGQHRNADLGVFILARDGQRPEMRRRPDEHDEEQQQRVRIDACW